MADERFAWQCSFQIPWEDKYRGQALVAILSYIKTASNETQLHFEMEEDPETPSRVWVGVRASLSNTPINAVVQKVQKDIETLLTNFLFPWRPKSVWDWLREDHYK